MRIFFLPVFLRRTAIILPVVMEVRVIDVRRTGVTNKIDLSHTWIIMERDVRKRGYGWCHAWACALT